MHLPKNTRRTFDIGFSFRRDLVYRCLLGAILAIFVAFACGVALAQGGVEPHVTPASSGSFVADPAIPTVISPSSFRSGYFVLNKDFSLLTHSSVDSSLNGTCAAPSGFSASSATPRTFLNDTRDAYFTGQVTANANAGVSGFSFINTGLCETVTGPTIAGGTPAYSFSTNDVYHARLYVLSGFNGNSPDTLTVEVNLNNALSGGNFVSQLKSINLDTGGQYTSMATDTLGGASGIALTAITELKTATSPGNLWIYNQSSGAAYKILGPGGAPLPAVTSFIIPAQTNAGGNLLVLVNQDNLTLTNISNPPQDTTPFTIIDLGQLIQTFSIQTSGGTITLPFVTQIAAATPYFAMLGAAYNPVTRLVYAVVGGGSLAGVTGSVISYDLFNPGSPNETVVGDISNIPFSYGAYPQLALNAAAGTLQILTPAPSALYSVGILGTGNTAVAISGSTFPDNNFQPTYIAANPLLGETYIASASGQVDILKNAAATPLATFTLNGPDIGVTSQTYNLQGTALYAVDDTALRAAPVTITVTPAASGTPFTVAAGSVANFGGSPTNIPITFPALGTYTMVASIPATANYPAITSNPINVKVASNFIAGVYPTSMAITAPSNPATTAVNVLVNLNGSTYAPTGYINVNDENGNTVGTTYFNGAAMVAPTVVAVTLTQGSNTLTASYSGDAQNAASTSPALTVVVGTQVTPGLTLTVTSPAFVGNSVSGNVKFTSTTTNVPTGSVTVYGVLAGSSSPITLTTVVAAQAFTSSGANYSFNAPVAGTYEVYASYDGDTNYASGISSQQSLITNVVPVNTTTGISASTTQSPGIPFAVTVRLAPVGTSTATPSGNVVVTAVLNSNGATTTLSTIPASQALVSGGYAAQVSIAAAGSYTVTANYAGDSNFNGSSGSLLVTVGSTTSTTTLGVSGPTTVAPGGNLPLTIRLTAQTGATATPTGNVVLTSTNSFGTTTLGTITAAQALASGGYEAQVQYSILGPYTVTATYAGDANFTGSTASLVITVTNGGTSPTTLGVSGPSNVVAGTSFVGTATLKSTGSATAAITGNVTFAATGIGTTVNSYVLGSMPASTALASGGAQFTMTIPVAGSYTLSAVYPGDSNYASATGSVVITVATAPLQTTSVAIVGPTSTTAGTSITENIFLTPGKTLSTAPTGNVVLALSSSGGSTTTVATVTAAHATQAGGFPVTVSVPKTGIYTLTASYAGDANYAASGNTASLTVNGLATTVALTINGNTPVEGPAGGIDGMIIQFTSAASSIVPTGNVVVTVTTPQGTTSTLATVSVSDASMAGIGSGFQPTVTGMNTITATYAGDGVFAASTTSVTVNVPPSVTSLVLSGGVGGTAPANLTYVLTLTGGYNPSGNIIVSATPNGGTAVPTNVTVAQATAAGGASVVISFPTVGTYTLVARYPGDANNAASASSVFTVVISSTNVPPSYTLTLDSSTPFMVQGNQTLAGITLTSFGGYSTPVKLSTMVDAVTDQSVVGIFTGDVIIAFQDHVTGKPITSAVPTPSGTHIDVVFTYATVTQTGLSKPANPGTSHSLFVRGSGLLLVALFGWKRRRTRAALTLMMMCVIVVSGMLLGGCALLDSLIPPAPEQVDTVTLDVVGTTTTAGETAKQVKMVISFFELDRTD